MTDIKIETDSDRLGYHCEKGAHDVCVRDFGGMALHFGEKVPCACVCHGRAPAPPTNWRARALAAEGLLEEARDSLASDVFDSKTEADIVARIDAHLRERG